jgi:hypothetical protein
MSWRRAGDAVRVLVMPCLLGFAPGVVQAADTSESEALDADAVAVQKQLGLFLTVPARRDAFERVERRPDGTLAIHLLRALPKGRREAVLCQGARWLLVGRQASSSGVATLFAALPEITAVELVFYGVDTEVSPGPDGRYEQKRRERPVARFRISREQGDGLSRSRVDAELAPGRCLDAARALLDELWAP